MELKKSVTAWVPVRLLDAGTPVAGVLFSDVTASVLKSDGTEQTVTVTNPDWVEAVGAALSGSGTYRLRIDASFLNVTGFLAYAVKIAAPPARFVGLVNVVDNIESDTFTLMRRAMGLMHENSVLDQTVFDGFNNLTAGRLRTYDSKANALAAGATGLIATYTITASFVGKNVTEYKVVLEP